MNLPDHGVDSLLDARPAWTAIRITGEIDYATSDYVTTTLDSALGPDTGRCLFVDLIGVTFFGSIGISLLIHAKQHAAETGRTIAVIVGTNRAVLRSLEVSGMRQLLPMFESCADAATATSQLLDRVRRS